MNNVLIVASFIALLVSFWNRNDLPGSIDFVPGIFEEPLQTPTDRGPFNATVNGVEYLVEPEYAYDLTGMVVSFRRHEGNSRMHLQANDHLNMMDVCVVWGDNTRSDLHAIDFWNGIFTCNVFTRDRDAWESFDMNQLSNNHLISDDDFIRRQASKIRIGDQVRFRGFLAAYSSGPGMRRGTSTTRMDTGDGACETVYVERFEIVQAATSWWRIAMWASLGLLSFGLAVHFRRPYRPF